MQKKFFNKKIFNRKTIIILSVIVCIVVIIALFSNSLRDVVKEAIKPDESKLSQTYNASRYFFRVGYPDDWYVEEDANGFGFKKDNEKGLVIRMLNKNDSAKTVVNSQMPSATDGNTVTEVPTLENDYTTVINFFYRGIKDGEKLSNLDACKRYMDELVAGLMYGDEFEIRYEFSDISEYTADNLKFSFVEYKCMVYAKAGDSENVDFDTAEPIKVFTGDLYVAARSMAYYAINFETELDSDSAEYTDYKKDFMNILNDFRFSVFDD